MRSALCVLALCCSICGLCACPAPSSSTSAAPPTLVLRSYDVPEGLQGDVASTLNSLLYRGEGQPKAGSVGVAPSGQLLVSAPAEFHPGIKELVDSLKSGKAKPTALSFDLWVVTGAPASSATPGASVAVDIASVVDDLQKAQGPMRMELLERTSLHMTSGSVAQAEGLESHLRAQATLSGDGVLADLGLRRRAGAEGRLDVHTVLPLDKTVVLGQVGALGSRLLDTSKERTVATVFYVVRATRVTP